MQSKVCTKCGVEKPLEYFHKLKLSKDGHRSICKECRSTNPQKGVSDGYKRCHSCKEIKLTDEFFKHSGHNDGLSSQCKNCKSEIDKQYRLKNKAKIKISQHNYYEKNKEEIKTGVRAYRKANRDKCSAREQRYKKERMLVDINYKLKSYLRRRIVSAVKNKQKGGSAIEALGCSIEFFKGYIENLFQSGMTWKNYGKWHLDHIIPLALFDLTNREQLLKACHYTNYQPLWAKDNFSKGAKLNWIKNDD